MLIVEALFDTRYEFAYNFGLALSDLNIIESHIVGSDTVLCGVLSVVVLFGTIEQGFGRDTAHIETGAAEGGLLKEDDILACSRGHFCGSIARWATADNSEKVFHICMRVLRVLKVLRVLVGLAALAALVGLANIIELTHLERYRYDHRARSTIVLSGGPWYKG